MHGSHERALRALERRGRLRSLAGATGLDFSSNDYLGLGASSELRQAIASALADDVPIGAGGSRLLRGNHPEHERLEAEAADFFKAQSALFVGGGFMANYAIFSTLPQRGDLVVYDTLIHASVHDGMRGGRAEAVGVPHNDAESVERAIATWRAAGGRGQAWIAVESLYSMDGDRAPLADLAAIADRHEAMLVIDEAHATGVFGPEGRGLGAELEGRTNVVTLHTCGKALGVMGALVLGPEVLKAFLINRCRAFIYATAPSPLVAAAVRAALSLSARDDERRNRLARRIALVNSVLPSRCGVSASGSQIQPVVVGSDTRAVQLAAAMQAQGFDVRAVRPPTVPEGSARLRLSLTLNVSDEDTESMLEALAAQLKRLAP